MGFGEVSRYLLEHIGLTIPSHRRSLWVHGDTPLQFDAARPLMQAIMAERPHVRLVVTSRRLRTLQFLRSTFPDERTLPVLCSVGPVVRHFMRKLQVRHVLLLDGGRSFPGPAISLAVSQCIPISAVNIGSLAALNSALLEAVRRHPGLLRLCVYDELVAQQFRVAGVPAVSIAITGCLDLEGGRGAHWPSSAAGRRLLQLRDKTPVVAAVDLPREEERMVLDAFAGVRDAWPNLRLLIEPRKISQLARLRTEIRQRGWIPMNWLHSAPLSDHRWDVLLSASPGNLTALLPITIAVIVGGTHSSGASGAYLAAAISAGATALIGPRREFEDVPWRLLKSSSLVHPCGDGSLAWALGAAIRGSKIRNSQPAAHLSTASALTHAAISGRLPDSPELPIVAQDWKVPTLRERGSSSRIWRLIAPALMRNRIDTWGDLGSRLRNPVSVLCLGNGPSSENRRLADFPHDCLIRVNWRWKLRGFLVNPQVVFVGDPATIHKLDHAVFGLWNKSLEYGMLLRHSITRGPLPMKYFTMERISPLVRDRTWPARPSNGALMIAAGAALEPERLIIAGIDLYLHPEGRYPGDLLGDNQYSRVHSRDTDLAIIRGALAQYRGELVILSDILRSALETTEEVTRAGC